MVPQPNDKCPYKTHTKERHTGREEMEAETGVEQPQAKGLLEPPEVGRGQEEIQRCIILSHQGCINFL